MIVVMKPFASQEMIDRIIRRVEELGMKPQVIVGVERTVVAATGAERNGVQAELEAYEEVEKVMPILAPYKIASRETRREPTIVTAGSLTIGDGQIGVIAGPCSVESEEQIMLVAAQVKTAGAPAPPRGPLKPRPRPPSFPGGKQAGPRLCPSPPPPPPPPP